MKYLKKFEFQEQKYNTDDYVYVKNLIRFSDEKENIYFYPYGQIGFSNSKDHIKTWDYMVLLIKDNKCIRLLKYACRGNIANFITNNY
jgi:hypothetical protein